MTPFSRRRFVQVAASSIALAPLSCLRAADAAPAVNDWKQLFDGKTLTGWKSTDFGGHGEVKVENGSIVLEAGNDLTGVNYTGEIPKIGYEVEVEASKLEGNDFFCGLTVPYGDAGCTFVVGGWGGALVGLSSINGDDASENETVKFMKIVPKQWYRVKMRVTKEKIEGWIDDEQYFDVTTQGKKISMRPGEIEQSQPFGIASFRTEAAIRSVKLRRL